MPSAVETAVDNYIRAVKERDPTVRASLVESCLAPDCRIVARSREIRGCAAFLEELARLHADPELSGIHITSAIDAIGSTFRFRSQLERRDGTRLEFFDAGQIDASGKIALSLVFAGPLGDAADSANVQT